jgi:hypothetical protein
MLISRRILVLLLALAVISFAAVPLAAQAITPDPAENQLTKDDTGCLGYAKPMVQQNGHGDDIKFETYMTSAIDLSPVALTATLPLHKGYFGAGTGVPVYYIITESSDCKTAKKLGINYSPKLGFLIDSSGNPVNKSVQKATVDAAGAFHFTGTVDFSPVRIFTPSTDATPNFLDPTADGPQGFPAQGFPAPGGFSPGSVGDSNYTPLITYTDAAGKHIVLNATQVANATGIKDFIPAIDFTNMTVTFNLVHGIYNFHFVLYLRMDASDPLVSAFEGGIFAPNLGLAPINGDRFFADGSARQTILPIVNGVRGVDQIFDRQGVQSAALGEGDPFNVTGGKAGELEYSPLWDITPPVWTPAAVAAGKRQRLHQDDEVASFIAAGLMESWAPAAGAPNGDFKGPLAPAGLKSLNIVSNCPIMLRVLEGAPTLPPSK